jgi:hypothetical protein
LNKRLPKSKNFHQTSKMRWRSLSIRRIAACFLAESKDEQKWETRFAATTDDRWDLMAAMVRQEIAKGETVFSAYLVVTFCDSIVAIRSNI